MSQLNKEIDLQSYEKNLVERNCWITFSCFCRKASTTIRTFYDDRTRDEFV